MNLQFKVAKRVISVTELDMIFYRESRWNALATVESTPFPDNTSATLIVDDIEFVGNIIHSAATTTNRCRVMFVAGNGDINNFPKETCMSGPSVSSVVQQLLLSSGNTLNTKLSDSGLLSKRFATYTIVKNISIWRQLYILLSQFSAVARFHVDGSVIISRDLSPSQISIPKSWIKLQESESLGISSYTIDKLSTIPLPGQLSESGDMIETVQLQIDATTTAIKLSSVSQYASEQITAQSQIAFNSSYTATVVSQQSNNKLQVKFDDTQFASSGLADVVIRYGNPLQTNRIESGTKVSVKFDTAGKPYVDEFYSQFATSPLPTTSNTVYLGNPQDSRGVSRQNDGTITYLPSLWKAKLVHGPILTSGGIADVVIKLEKPVTQIPSLADGVTAIGAQFSAPAIKLAGLIKTCSKILRIT